MRKPKVGKLDSLHDEEGFRRPPLSSTTEVDGADLPPLLRLGASNRGLEPGQIFIGGYIFSSEKRTANVLNRSVPTLRRWRSCRRGPAYISVQGQIIYRDDAIAHWLLKQERNFEDHEKSGRGAKR
jgi:hypothetical protein